jgi:hypothetical protein
LERTEVEHLRQTFVHHDKTPALAVALRCLES